MREQRLWHRAQEAYKTGDVVSLENVLSHIEAAAAGTTALSQNYPEGHARQAKEELS
jgi:hypothetical protein